MTDMTVANEILRQLGGAQFRMMTGSKEFVGGADMLSFKVGSGAKNGINRVKITLTPADTYDVEFFKLRGVNLKTIKKVEGIFCDMLREVFKEATGFYCTLR